MLREPHLVTDTYTTAVRPRAACIRVSFGTKDADALVGFELTPEQARLLRDGLTAELERVRAGHGEPR